jgi:hypothetical protein
MARDTESAPAEQAVQVSPMVHIVAPLVAIGATMIARSLLNRGYRAVTGSPAPGANDPGVTFARAVMWAGMTAATAAIVEVAVYRMVQRAGTHPAA